MHILLLWISAMVWSLFYKLTTLTYSTRHYMYLYPLTIICCYMFCFAKSSVYEYIQLTFIINLAKHSEESVSSVYPTYFSRFVFRRLICILFVLCTGYTTSIFVTWCFNDLHLQRAGVTWMVGHSHSYTKCHNPCGREVIIKTKIIQHLQYVSQNVSYS